MSSVANRVIKNSAWLYAKMAIILFVTLLTTRLLLNSLGAADFGIYSVVGGAISMLGFISGAMTSATQRFMSYYEGEQDLHKQRQIFNVSIVIHLLLGAFIIVVLLAGGVVFFSHVFNIDPTRVTAAKMVYLCVIASTFLTVINTPYEAVMTAHENMRYYALMGIVESLLKLAVAYAVVYTSSDKLVVYGLLMAGIPLLTLTFMKIYCHRHYPQCVLSLSQYFHKPTMVAMIKFAGWNLLGFFSGMVGHYGNSLVMNHFFGAVLNAAMGIATQLNGQLMGFSLNMRKALNPVITKTEGSGQRSKMLQYTNTGSKFSFALLALLSIPFLVEMDFVERVWLVNPPEWAVTFTRLMLVRSLLEQLTITYQEAINAEGRIARLNLLTFLLYLSPLLLSCMLFSQGFSPVWMFYLNILFFGLLPSMVKVYFIHTNCGMPYVMFFRQLLLPVSASFLLSLSLAALPSLWLSQSWLRLVLSGCIGVVSYPLLFWFLSMNERERKIFCTASVTLRHKLLPSL